MQITRTRQDYYAHAPPASPLREAGSVQSAAGKAARAGVLPAERVVEGEWQKGRAAGDPFERLRGSSVKPEAQRAIDAYRAQAMAFDARLPLNTGRVDYYA